jgi:RNA polymerase sigma-70 factor (ECF subfamily)
MNTTVYAPPTRARASTSSPEPAEQPGAGGGLSAEERHLLDALRRGEEEAFVLLIERYSPGLLHLALTFVSNRTAAEGVVQDTWLGVLHGLDRFEGRSSLKTWIFRILANRARSRAQHEARCVPFSALIDAENVDDEPAVDPERFLPPDHERWPGHWASVPRRWDDIPEHRLLSQEIREHVQNAIYALPAMQRTVITLRDVEGWGADEVCTLLEISEANQRVLLHRARSRVRRALECYFDEE